MKSSKENTYNFLFGDKHPYDEIEVETDLSEEELVQSQKDDYKEAWQNYINDWDERQGYCPEVHNLNSIVKNL